MRILVKQNSPEKLVLKLKPTGAWLLIGFGLLLILTGPLIVWTLGYVTEISVNQETFVWRQSLLGKYDAMEKKISADEITTVGTKVYEDGISKTLDVTIGTTSGEFRVPIASLDGDEKEALADDLDAYFKSPQGEFHYSSGTDLIWGALLLASVVSLGGLVCIFQLQTSVVFGDREQGKLCVKTGRWLSPFKKIDCIDLKDYHYVNHREFTTTTSETPTTSSNSVEVHTYSGRYLPLARGPMFTDASTVEIQELIENWVKEAEKLDKENG